MCYEVDAVAGSDECAGAFEADEASRRHSAFGTRISIAASPVLKRPDNMSDACITTFLSAGGFNAFVAAASLFAYVIAMSVRDVTGGAAAQRVTVWDLLQTGIFKWDGFIASFTLSIVAMVTYMVACYMAVIAITTQAMRRLFYVYVVGLFLVSSTWCVMAPVCFVVFCSSPGWFGALGALISAQINALIAVFVGWIRLLQLKKKTITPSLSGVEMRGRTVRRA